MTAFIIKPSADVLIMPIKRQKIVKNGRYDFLQPKLMYFGSLDSV